MRKYIGSVAAIAIAIAFAGCASSTASNAASIANQSLESQHSPFRWEVAPAGDGSTIRMYLVPLPSAPTIADAQLTADIKKLLSQAEASQGRNSGIVVNDIKIWVSASTVRKEIWVLEAKDRLYAYIVELRSSPRGGTDISASGPTAIARK